jgi:hypothetical protein
MQEIKKQKGTGNLWILSVRKSNYLPINLGEFTKFTSFLGQGQIITFISQGNGEKAGKEFIQTIFFMVGWSLEVVGFDRNELRRRGGSG